jgi:hypothetical protein
VRVGEACACASDVLATSMELLERAFDSAVERYKVRCIGVIERNCASYVANATKQLALHVKNASAAAALAAKSRGSVWRISAGAARPPISQIATFDLLHRGARGEGEGGGIGGSDGDGGRAEELEGELATFQVAGLTSMFGRFLDADFLGLSDEQWRDAHPRILCAVLAALSDFFENVERTTLPTVHAELWAYEVERLSSGGGGGGAGGACAGGGASDASLGAAVAASVALVECRLLSAVANDAHVLETFIMPQWQSNVALLLADFESSSGESSDDATRCVAYFFCCLLLRVLLFAHVVVFLFFSRFS